MVAVAAADFPFDDDRISQLHQPVWIRYERGERALERLEYLLRLPPMDRSPNLLIPSWTNNGKTSILRRFIRQYKAKRDPKAEADFVPVLYVEVPPRPTEGDLYEEIIRALGGRLRHSARVGEKRHEALTLLKNVKVRLLMLDEIQHILNAKRDAIPPMLDTIKSIGNQVKIPVVAAGTMEALQVFTRDNQLDNRFERVKLPKWDMSEAYLRLLAGFETTLQLKKASCLTDEDLARTILAMSEGTIGEIATLLRLAAMYAITSGIECINEQVLRACSYVPPSSRRDG
jgi:hypothetical protein